MTKKGIDYSFKSYVLKEHQQTLFKYRIGRKKVYNDYLITELGMVAPTYELYKDCNTPFELLCDCSNNGQGRIFEECVKIDNAYIKRVQRLKKRIENIITNNDSLFLTITFNDETLNNTTESKRRLLVIRYLKSCNCKYVANIDYGKENGREHYHAVISTNHINYTEWHKFGAINGKIIIRSNVEALSRYVAKLTNHAIKETTKRNHIIYSRDR